MLIVNKIKRSFELETNIMICRVNNASQGMLRLCIVNNYMKMCYFDFGHDLHETLKTKGKGQIRKCQMAKKGDIC